MSKEFEEKVLEGLKEFKNRFDSIETRLDTIETRLDTIETRLDTIETRLDTIETRLDTIETRLDTVEIRLDKIETRLDKLEEKVDNMNVTIILIEDKISNEIPAQFDSYSFNYDLQKEDQKKIDSLEKKSFNHSVRISNLEITTEEHSEKIKKLIS